MAKVLGSVLPSGPNDSKSRHMACYDHGNYNTVSNADVRPSVGKQEVLLTSSIGKETPSQFDFSNGLPECLRSGHL